MRHQLTAHIEQLFECGFVDRRDEFGVDYVVDLDRRRDGCVFPVRCPVNRKHNIAWRHDRVKRPFTLLPQFRRDKRLTA